MSALSSAIEASREIRDQRYADASAVFLAGSVVRGEETKHSDLDLVVIFERLEQASRVSFLHGTWPVEAFIHDPETAEYFFWEVDRPSGVPALADMIAGGLEIPAQTEFSDRMKMMADKALDEGPPLWGEEDRNHSRYVITDIMEDLRSPRSRQELQATLTRLYPALANHFFRSRGIWSATGKSIPRRLAAIDSEFSQRFSDAFASAFESGKADEIIELTCRTLEPDGGLLFDGYCRLAPKDWRAG